MPWGELGDIRVDRRTWGELGDIRARIAELLHFWGEMIVMYELYLVYLFCPGM